MHPPMGHGHNLYYQDSQGNLSDSIYFQRGPSLLLLLVFYMKMSYVSMPIQKQIKKVGEYGADNAVRLSEL
jgi:hypothetical protein